MRGLQDDWGDLFLASSGRIGRVPFLVGAAVVVAVAVLYQTVPGHIAHLATGWAVYPVLVFCAASVLSKRLHDRGRSGWWSALIMLAAILVWPRPRGVIDFLACLVLVWAMVDLGLLPGQRGGNRYGPDPAPSSTIG